MLLGRKKVASGCEREANIGSMDRPTENVAYRVTCKREGEGGGEGSEDAEFALT